MTNHVVDPDSNSSVLGKISKVSPLIVFGAGALLAFSGSYFGQQQHSASVEAEIKQLLVQHDSEIRELKTNQIQLRNDVVPRSEHEAMLEDNKTLAHWIEKYNDAVQGNLQHQIDELRSKK